MLKMIQKRSLFTAFLAVMIIVASVDARGGRSSGGGSRSYSSKSFSSSSGGSLFGSSSKKSFGSSSSKRSYGTTGSSTRSVGSFFGSKKSSKSSFESAKSQSLSKSKSKSVLDSYSGKTSTSVKRRFSAAPRSSNYGWSSRADRRTVFYNSYNMPQFYYSPYAAYGPFDGMFLGMMLGSFMSNAHHSMFMYSHWNDPSIMQWRHEMEIQARENAELRSQMAALENQVNRMKAEGVPADSTYLPEDIDPDMVYSDEYVDRHADEFYPDQPKEKKGNPVLFFIGLIVAILVIRHIFFVRKF